MKRFYRVLLALMDDFLFIGGAVCFIIAAWYVDFKVGLATLGAFLIVYAVIIARGKR